MFRNRRELLAGAAGVAFQRLSRLAWIRGFHDMSPRRQALEGFSKPRTKWCVEMRLLLPFTVVQFGRR